MQVYRDVRNILTRLELFVRRILSRSRINHRCDVAAARGRARISRVDVTGRVRCLFVFGLRCYFVLDGVCSM